MLIRGDTQSSFALFEQIAVGLRRAIADGSVRPGDRPPPRELPARLGANMHTVLRAYQSFRAEGMVSMHRSRGAVVVAKRSRASAALAELVEELADRVRASASSPTKPPSC